VKEEKKCPAHEKTHVDFVYDSKVSLLAKTSIKLKPILEQLVTKMIPETFLNHTEPQASEDFSTSFDKCDMRNLLGYLNQSDWIWSLNIGNIMQISPLTMQDIYNTSSVEYELSRELILEKICFLSVSYFCVSTELRFLV
jgi:hypothetical protein